MRTFVVGLALMIVLALAGAGMMDRLQRPTVEQSQRLGSVEL